MRRREFIALAGASIAWPFGAMAQEPGRTYRLGAMSSSSNNSLHFVAMFDQLRRLGFIKGQNLTVDWRSYEPRTDLIPQFVADIVKSQVDVILVFGDTAIRAAQQATTTIPILAGAEDMLGSGLVDSMARPGGNTTGHSILGTELDGKRQEILIEAVPGLRHMAVLADPNTIGSRELKALQDSARARSIELSIHQISNAEEITTAIDAAKASGAAALNVLSSPFLYGNRQIVMHRVAALRMPTIYQFPEEAEEGGFAAYGPSLIQMFREQVAYQLVKLFRGIKVADIPVDGSTSRPLRLWV
jgi:putative ABC transport system substrate-binding protein